MPLLSAPLRNAALGAIIALACAGGAARADELTLQDNAPERYVVVKGDTLWGISGKFLKDPWKWPQIWHMNQDEIKNPHWIFPGDVIVLDTSSGEPRLRLLGNEANDALRNQLVHVEPHVRITPLEDRAAPTIPRNAIEPLLVHPLVVDEADFQHAPRIALPPKERVQIAKGDKFYAVGNLGGTGTDWQVYSGNREIHDPITKELLGYEVTYNGDATTEEPGNVSALEVTSSVREMVVGDRLLPKIRPGLVNYVPRVPTAQIEGKILSTYGGVGDAGVYTTVLINKGTREGLAPGHILFTYKAARPVLNEKGKEDKHMMAPPEKIGTLYLYRVFQKMSYGLVVSSSKPITQLDDVRTP